jgi:hypothetical protein
MRWQDDLPRHDVVTIPIVWVAFVLSLLLHIAALLLVWPHIKPMLVDAMAPGNPGALAVEIAPRASAEPSAEPAAPPPAPSIATRPTPAPAPRRAPPRAVARAPTPPAVPPIIATERPVMRAPEQPKVVPTPPVTPPAPPAAEPTPPAPTPLESDLASYVESRRRARGESPSAGNASDAPPAETEAERRNRIIAANLGLNRTPTFGYDPTNAGGLFQVREVNYDDAVFYFYGMDHDINRAARQRIEVRRGSNPDIRIAVVRKMIEIIRENVSGDFMWESHRLGKNVQMSARPADNAQLEAFILRDIFPDYRGP